MSVILHALKKASESSTPHRVALPPQKSQRTARITRSPWMVLAFLLNGLLLAAIGYDLTRSYFSSSGTDIASQTEVPVAGVVAQGASVAVNRPSWSELHPFGQHSVVSETEKPRVLVPEEAPDTQLQLTLTGVLAASESGRSLVTLRTPTDGEKTYADGDTLAGGHKIVSVRTDRIILEKSGRFETLRLPRSVVSLDGGGPGSQGKSGESAQETLKRLKSQFMVQPEVVFGKFTVAPQMKNGQFAGYVINPGNEAGLLEKLGLQPGDLLTVVNGVALTTPLKGMEALGTLEKSQELQLTLLRHGKSVTLHHTMRP